MKTTSSKILALAGLAVGAAGLLAFAGSAARAASPEGTQSAASQSTPGKWNWEIKDGKRVPKASSRIVNPDGSWRETIKQGRCTTVKERTAGDEYKETRSCD
jgi:hypothetical protein